MKIMSITAVLALIFTTAVSANQSAAVVRPINQVDVAKCAAGAWFVMESAKNDKGVIQDQDSYDMAADIYYFTLDQSTNERMTIKAGNKMVKEISATDANSPERDRLVNSAVDACERIDALKHVHIKK